MVNAAAADWIARRDRGEWSGEDQEAFERWLRAATEHRVAYLRLNAAWTAADALRAETAPAQRRPIARRVMAFAAMAATLAMAVFAGLQVAPQSYATKVGGARSEVLEDGSRVELNTDTKITVSYSKGERRVRLVRGEAFFTVAKNKARPFIVQAGDYSVTAVGTAFAVRRQGDQVAVTVEEGRVAVARRDLPPAGKPPIFGAGAIVEARPEATRVVAQEAARVEEALNWRRGIVIFEDSRLADVAAEFNRYNETKLVIPDPALAEARVGGAFRPTNLDAFVRIVADDLGIAARRDGDRILLEAG